MKGWNGNILEPGPYVADGWILLYEDYTDRRLMHHLRRPFTELGNANTQKQAAELWEMARRRAIVPLEWIGQVAIPEFRHDGRVGGPLIADQFQWGDARRPMPTVDIDSGKLDLLWRAIFFEGLLSFPNKRHAIARGTGEVVARVGGEMVGVVMPLWGGLP